MKKLLFIIDSLENNGAVRSLVSLLNELNSPEYQISLFVINDRLDYFRKEIPDYVTVIKGCDAVNNFFAPFDESVKWYCRKGHWAATFIKCMHSIIRRISPVLAQEIFFPLLSCNSGQKIPREYDFVIAYNDFTPWVYAYHHARGKMYIGWNHSIYENMKYHDFFYKKYLKKMNRIATISEICKASLMKHFNYCKNIHIVTNIINQKEVLTKSEDRVDVIFPKDKISVLSIGRLSEQKGYSMFIHALARIQTTEKWCFYLIGEGPDKEKLEKLIAENNLTSKVVLLGAKKNPYPYLVQCDVYVQPSKYEGYGIALDEAKIFQKPILATDTVKERFCHGKDALILPFDEHEWAEALKKIIEDKTLRMTLSAGTEDSKNKCGLEQFYSLLCENEI